VVLRLSPTFMRFGSFEIFKPRDAMTGREGPSVGNTQLLHQASAYAPRKDKFSSCLYVYRTTLPGECIWPGT
jgi:hypothetical protein